MNFYHVQGKRFLILLCEITLFKNVDNECVEQNLRNQIHEKSIRYLITITSFI